MDVMKTNFEQCVPLVSKRSPYERLSTLHTYSHSGWDNEHDEKDQKAQGREMSRTSASYLQFTLGTFLFTSSTPARDKLVGATLYQPQYCYPLLSWCPILGQSDIWCTLLSISLYCYINVLGKDSATFGSENIVCATVAILSEIASQQNELHHALSLRGLVWPD
ncbi:hypothetical protein BKA67DRAFT_531207 [Truncatella angustata]|uniref:Uncharacterized protein n=1 Tax=Truncatella angustata TaxID=152316 RepID=A0A9P8UYY0_9PEZI|nr:uncharacterized protein BKA67DRAFT_531207 [Truncatella angustata]KAH6661136.1 hypothetical protein BKA67DRAFT_531207 [Truncatella angustata]